MTIAGGSGSVATGDVNILAGSGGTAKLQGTNTLISASDNEIILTASSSTSGNVTITVPVSYKATTQPDSIGSHANGLYFGFNYANGSNYVMQIKDSRVSVSSPLAVTLVQYSSDMRIKQDIESVDEDAILQRIQQTTGASNR